MQLTLKKPPRLTVVYEGASYELSRPTLGDSVLFEERAAEAQASGKAAGRLMIDFLEARGLPKDVALTMEPELILEIVEALVPKKKG